MGILCIGQTGSFAAGCDIIKNLFTLMMGNICRGAALVYMVCGALLMYWVEVFRGLSGFTTFFHTIS